jgi:hypothetical protein
MQSPVQHLLRVTQLNAVPAAYAPILRLQELLFEQRKKGLIPDTLLMLEVGAGRPAVRAQAPRHHCRRQRWPAAACALWPANSLILLPSLPLSLPATPSAAALPRVHNGQAGQPL